MDSAEQTELQRVIKELEFRTTVTSAMLSTLDLDRVLYVILSGITSGDGLGFNRAFLFLVDEADRFLRVRMAVGPPSRREAHKIWAGIKRERLTLTGILPRYESYRSQPRAQSLTKRMASFSLPMDRLEGLAVSLESMIIGQRAPLAGVLARCLVNGSPFSSNAMTLFHELGGARGEEISFSNMIILPLKVADQLIGAILADNLYSGAEVSSEEMRSMTAFGNLAALAIDRASLHTKTVTMTEVDGLTGVFNRRYYQRELERILEVSGESGQYVSIVVFDLDHFKICNDRHGHLVGDEVLKDVARILRENIRGTDRVARYGGEEFVLLLTDTRLEAAEGVAHKLRRLVKSGPLASGRVKTLTLSAGVASSRGKETVDELFLRADRALYRAKEDGRDRVVVWTPELDRRQQ